MSCYVNRRAQVAQWMEKKGIACAVFEDGEGKRNPAVRYLSGQPGDALLYLFGDGSSVLVAWDLNMAKSMAEAEEILSYGDFERTPEKATAAILARRALPRGSLVALPQSTSHPSYLRFKDSLPGYELECRDDGIDSYVAYLRAVKDPQEIAVLRRACSITDEIGRAIEAAVREGRFRLESEVALFIESEARRMGAEGTGFETIAAGPERSFGIHAFPAYTGATFGGPGLSILDFGIKLEGYTSDVTLSFAREPLTGTARRRVELVARAYAQAKAALKPGIKSREVALIVDGLFAEAGFTMPHALGHGIGLEAHEAPAVRSRADNEWKLEPGMVFTLEPGLYDYGSGGVRLEDDFLMGPQGAEALTHSRIIEL